MADAVTADGRGGGRRRDGTRRRTIPAKVQSETNTTDGPGSKRKRSDTTGAVSGDVGTPVAEDAPAPGSIDGEGGSMPKPASKRKTSAKRKPATQKEDSNDAETDSGKGPTPRKVDAWPEWFRDLEKTHRALNLVYTICCTRKHLLTTFATIKTAVESNTGRPLLESDVAAVAALLSLHFNSGSSSADAAGTIRFAYVDELSLQVDIQGAERDTTFKTGATSRTRNNLKAQGPAADASVGGITGREAMKVRPDGGVYDEQGTQGQPLHKEVLYFEFIDEGLKREVANPKTGEPTKSTRMLRDEQLRMPVYGQKQMTALIEKRNRRFAAAVNAFLDRCEGLEGDREATDPVECLKSEAEAFIPVPSPEEGLVDARPSRNNGDTDCDDNSNNGIPPTIPAERKTIPEIVDELKNSPWYSGQVVPDGHRVFEEQEPVYGDLGFLLSQDTVNALYNAKGITQFYVHQAEAINALHAGRHVVVSTSTSSGKSLIFQLPVVHALEEDPFTRAMYIFPTKALAQDQKRSLRDLLAYMPNLCDVLAETFDGDTPWKERDRIREEARVLFTNPDMLHAAILPQESRWRSFLQRLRYVVVDELHYYNGLMGSHMAFIMRRLRRVCATLGNRSVRFISCSATVANPREHFETIFGVMDWERDPEQTSPVQLVDFDGSPSGRKEFLCWNTPFRVPGDPASGRGSALYECARLFCELILRGVRVIAFCRVREQCEKLVGAVQQELERRGRHECLSRVMGYRGGYTAHDRRRIEADMFAGRLVGIVATTALELGVDIGSLDCVMTWGFPYSIANLRQQSGRAGRRRGRDSLSILVGDSFATDQYYMQNPDMLFDQPHGSLQVDLANMLVREGHVQCAAYEMPIRPADDEQYFGPGLAALCAERLVRDEMDCFHCHDHFRPQPWKLVAIRDTEDDHFAIVDIGHNPPIVLEELEASRATFTIYDGAIFLHQGTTYLVREFSPDQGLARVERVRVDWTTQQRDFTDIDPIETQAIRRIGEGGPAARDSPDAARAYLGKIRISQTVFGYFKVDRRERILDAVQVDNPPVVRYSRGAWVDVPASGLAVLERRRLHMAAAIHAAEHAVLSLLPNFVISLPGDVRTECKSGLKEFQNRPVTQRKRPARLTFYDAKGGAGGTGITAKAFDFVDLLLQQALTRIESCACGLYNAGDALAAARGCLECIASPNCHEANLVMSKAGAVVVLRSLLGLPIDEYALPMGPEEGIPAGPETVVLATPVPGVHAVPAVKMEPLEMQSPPNYSTQ
ncbi:DEAD/DEAH box helicase domain-containing protein [Sporothrix brasiliensis 5110]|uniref:DEAD/DEAH box helicase domain-containing protein n=1 Tax=Sporothrix brasiliensis 5110 TaxID=1398154 RepID=A0A0C2EUJ0_9PEZI|nr:DEAD/DEAH box helicase domain-containing protein [Sporothrix brasiliensis 5110]KIH90204.1 DEAD/DEAH box helicase domain-containing protein [Sporothrix brasiliensis 5110]